MVLVLLAACGSVWFIDQDGEGWGRPPLQAFYRDDDGDGWGDPASDVQYLHFGDQANHYTANNALDCDDLDNDVTGRTGYLCPDELDGEGTSIVAVTYDATELVAVTDGSPPVWPQAAEDACAAWGGALVTADPTWTALLGDRVAGPWATWLPATSTDDGWVGPDGAPVNGDVPWCGDPLPTDAPGVALVERADGSWCVGPPEAAHADGYGPDRAQFACERPAPDPSAYAAPDTGR